MWEVIIQTVPDLLPKVGEAIELKNAVTSFNNGDYWQSAQHLSFALLGVVGLDKIKDVYKFIKGAKSAWKVFKLVKKLRLWAFSDEAVKGFIKVGLNPNKLTNHIFRNAPGHMPDLQPLISATGGKMEALEAVYKKAHDLGHLNPNNLPLNVAQGPFGTVLHGVTINFKVIRVFNNGDYWIEIADFWVP